MVRLKEHPTVQHYQAQTWEDKSDDLRTKNARISAESLRQLCIEAGADDVGFVEIGRPALDDQRDDILNALPGTKTLISFVVKMNREPIRTPARSIANLEFHSVGHDVNETGRHIVRQLEARGIRALNPAMGFPMEMESFPGKIWVVSHKPVAVAAGLGKIGIHRNVIHPKFGNFILLGTLLMEAEVTDVGKPVDFNPCLECKLCVAACPVGAIGPDGHFDFASCYNHNYREFMSGFTNWVENVADSKDAREYRQKVDDRDSASMWQSLSFGANYKAAYCLSVCPAGEDVIGPFLENRKAFLKDVVKPLQDKEEPVYVLRHSDAEAHAQKRFPHKETRIITNSLRPRSIEGFLRGISLTFQRHQSKDIDATYHFRFTGKESKEATIHIRNKTLVVEDGLVGDADLFVTADSETWLKFLAQDANIVWAIVRRKVRVKGPLSLLKAFARCFPN